MFIASQSYVPGRSNDMTTPTQHPLVLLARPFPPYYYCAHALRRYLHTRRRREEERRTSREKRVW